MGLGESEGHERGERPERDALLPPPPPPALPMHSPTSTPSPPQARQWGKAVEKDPEAPSDGPAQESEPGHGGCGSGSRGRPPGVPLGPCTYLALPGGRPLAAWSRFGEKGRPERGASCQPAGTRCSGEPERGRRGPGEGERSREAERALGAAQLCGAAREAERKAGGA